jgi:site-specific DNA-cytosine methylase
VVELFSGIGGGRRALELLRLSPALYAAVECDTRARRVVKYAWPDVHEFDDVVTFGQVQISRLKAAMPTAKQVLLVAGSPCQGFTKLNAGAAGFEDKRSALFWEIPRILSLLQQGWPEANLAFIVENVSSMAPADQCTFSKALGVTPVGVAASDLAHCRRDRLYWCGPIGLCVA